MKRAATFRLLLLLLLPSCFLPEPRPMSEWEVRSHSLYPPAVWVEASDGTRGGGVVVASSPEGTYVLTAYHVVKGRAGLEVGAFRHSLAAPSPRSPEYTLYSAEPVAGGYVLDEAIRAPFEELVASLRRLLEAGGGVEHYPTLKRTMENFAMLKEGLEAARKPSDLAAALDTFLATRPKDDSELVGRELEEAVQRASAAAGDSEVGSALRREVDAAMGAVGGAVRQMFAGDNAVVFDVALLRVRTRHPLIAATCAPAGATSPSGAVGELVTIQPDGEPRARAVRIGDDFRIVGTSVFSGEIRQGNSGSPVFVDGRLIGIATAGLYPGDEEPGDSFREGVCLRIDAIRRWLARRGMDPLLD